MPVPIDCASIGEPFCRSSRRLPLLLSLSGGEWKTGDYSRLIGEPKMRKGACRMSHIVLDFGRKGAHDRILLDAPIRAFAPKHSLTGIISGFPVLAPPIGRGEIHAHCQGSSRN